MSDIDPKARPKAYRKRSTGSVWTVKRRYRSIGNYTMTELVSAGGRIRVLWQQDLATEFEPIEEEA